MKRKPRDIDVLAQSLRQRTLPTEHIEQFRARIGELEAAARPGTPMSASARDLMIVARQLEELARRSHGAPVDPDLISALPPSVKDRIDTRLANAAKRLAARAETAAAAATPRTAEPSKVERTVDPAFRCAEDYKSCMATAHTTSEKIWCNLAMIVCLARTIIPQVIPAPKKTGG